MRCSMKSLNVFLVLSIACLSLLPMTTHAEEDDKVCF